MGTELKGKKVTIIGAAKSGIAAANLVLDLGGHPKIVNPPGADPIHHEYFQGATTKLAYNDAGQNWNWKDTNYMRGQFTVDSEQYEKYAAGLAQKMAGMKKMPEPAK